MLDMLLGNQPGIVSIGQINRLPDFVDSLNKSTCSCSSTLQDCVFWGPVFKDLKSSGMNYMSRLSDPYHQTGKRLSQLKPVILKLIFGRALESGRKFDDKQNLLLNSVLKNSDSVVISDSSKNIMRLLALLANKELDVSVIFLVRSCQGVIASKLKRKSLRTANPWLSALSWAYQNLLCLMVFKSLVRSKRRLLYFDDLVKNPAKEIADIKQYFDLPIDFQPARTASVDPEHLHIFAGNKVSKTGKQQIVSEANNKNHFFNGLPDLLIGKPIEFFLRRVKN